jgi:hypothetical protein
VSGRASIRDYMAASLVAAGASYVVVFALVSIHELAHGFMAVALGGYFPFVRVGVVSGSAVYLFPSDSPAWKEALVLLAGPLTSLGAALLMMGLVVTGIKNRRAKLLALLAGELASLAFIFGTGLLSLWRPDGGGDAGRFLVLLAFPRVYQYLVGAIWLLLGALLALGFLRLLFKELAGSFPLALSRRQILAVAAAAVAVAAAQTILLGGVGGARPSGLFLTRKPPEVTVSACNVALTLGDEYRARVRVLMRPYVDRQGFLWERVRNDEPEDWAIYERFTLQKIPLMLGADDVRIVRRYSDSEAEFFNGTWGRGARVVEVEVNLSSLPYLRESREVRVLRVVDFWRSEGAGYIDLTKVSTEGGLRIGGFESQPEGADAPVVRTARQLQWENTSFDHSFTVSYIAIR